jgi:hypothetical protein
LRQAAKENRSVTAANNCRLVFMVWDVLRVVIYKIQKNPGIKIGATTYYRKKLQINAREHALTPYG